MPEELRRKQHLVSRGYQRNFSEAGFVAIVDAATGLIGERRSIRTNWMVPDFLSVVSAGGEIDDSLEREFGNYERVFLNVVREIRPFGGLGPRQRASIDALAAAHLVRSLAFASVHKELVAKVVEVSPARLGRDERAVQLFLRARGRLPRPGELESIVTAAANELAGQPDLLAGGVRRMFAQVEAHLRRFNIQLVGSDSRLPGFVLPDRPVVHGKRAEGRFGFAAAGAIGDADTVIVPLQRHLVALYTAKRLSDVQLTTKAAVCWVNSLLIRGAASEVACHPQDALDTSRLVRGIARYPAERFDDVAARWAVSRVRL